MIIAWFTQPQSSFSSYYQYDTVTGRFCRIRLELGRSGSNNNDTIISFKPKRYVGFSPESIRTTDKTPWTIEDEKLYYQGKPLPESKPTAGYRVYDCSDPTSFVHRGNPVVRTPNLPPGIEPRHLVLLANDAFETGGSLDLTPADATGEQLAAAIESRVRAVLNVGAGAEITDAMIQQKLTSQAEAISGDAAQQPAADLAGALDEAKGAERLIDEMIVEGGFVPTEAVNTAVQMLQSALSTAQSAGAAGDVAQAVTEIGRAQQAVRTALADAGVAAEEAVAKQFGNAETSLAEAQQSAATWQEVNAEYRPLTEASSVEEFEQELGLDASLELV